MPSSISHGYMCSGTLTKHDNMLRAMFSGRMEVLTDSDGWILIDRSGKHFGSILNFLRDGAVPLPETRREIQVDNLVLGSVEILKNSVCPYFTNLL